MRRVQVPVRRERDPAAIGREPRINLARAVVGQPLHVRAVLVRHPDVAEIAERNPARVIIRMACEPNRGGRRRHDAENDGEHARGQRRSPHHIQTSGMRGYTIRGCRRVTTNDCYFLVNVAAAANASAGGCVSQRRSSVVGAVIATLRRSSIAAVSFPSDFCTIARMNRS